VESIGEETERIDSILAEAGRKRSAAYDQILEIAMERLRILTHEMMRGYPSLARWEQTDDVFQEVVIRLYRTLKKVQPQSARHFFGLAAQQVRRTLIDLARHHFGPLATAANHESHFGLAELPPPASESTDGPVTLAEWAEFHEQIEKLPEEPRDVFSLIWYTGATHAEAAKILEVSTKTVQRRFLQARLLLTEAFQGPRSQD